MGGAGDSRGGLVGASLGVFVISLGVLVRPWAPLGCFWAPWAVLGSILNGIWENCLSIFGGFGKGFGWIVVGFWNSFRIIIDKGFMLLNALSVPPLGHVLMVRRFCWGGVGRFWGLLGCSCVVLGVLEVLLCVLGRCWLLLVDFFMALERILGGFFKDFQRMFVLCSKKAIM